MSAGNVRRSLRQWGKPATSTSTVSARFAWTAGRKAARHLSAMPRPAYPSWPAKARGLAMAEAYVLAGELRNCGGDHGAAFARYQERMMPFLEAQAAIGGEIRFVICPEDGVRH